MFAFVYFTEGFLSTCSFDYLSDSFDNKFFVTVLFTFAYVIPMMLIIFYYSLICKHVFSHEKALKAQAKKMNVASLRSNKSGASTTNAEVRIAKAAITICFLFVLGEYIICLVAWMRHRFVPVAKIRFLLSMVHIAWTPYRWALLLLLLLLFCENEVLKWN